jgi:hypothetical protein
MNWHRTIEFIGRWRTKLITTVGVIFGFATYEFYMDFRTGDLNELDTLKKVQYFAEWEGICFLAFLALDYFVIGPRVKIERQAETIWNLMPRSDMGLVKELAKIEFDVGSFIMTLPSFLLHIGDCFLKPVEDHIAERKIYQLMKHVGSGPGGLQSALIIIDRFHAEKVIKALISAGILDAESAQVPLANITSAYINPGVMRNGSIYKFTVKGKAIYNYITGNQEELIQEKLVYPNDGNWPHNRIFADIFKKMEENYKDANGGD